MPHQPDPSVRRGDAPWRDDVLKGCKEIANEIGESESTTYYLLENELIPGKKIGKKWHSSRSALRRHYAVTVQAA